MIELILMKVLVLKKCKETFRECNLCKFYYFLDKTLIMDHIHVMVVMICL